MKQKHVADIRAFNRFYTPMLGLLNRHILNSRYSLPEVRVLHEIYHHDSITASDIMTTLNIDKGYLSRVIQQFVSKKLVSKKVSPVDGRVVHLSVTPAGRSEFEILNEASNKQIKAILDPLSENDCDMLVKNMAEIISILSKTSQNN